MTKATRRTKPPSQPFSLLAAPSSSSTYCSARSSASSLTAAGACTDTSPRRSVDLDALFGEVLQGPGVERDRAGRRLLALELEVDRFLVHRDDVVLSVEDRLDDVVGGLVVHALVCDQDVHH